MQRLPKNLPPHLIVFDGECALCSRFYRFMLKHDHDQRFAFATAQSPIGQQLYQALDLPLQDFETNLVFTNGTLYQRLDAFTAAMRALGGIWHLPALLRFLPRRLKDFAYHRIARNRYRIFGRYETCMLPTQAHRARFVSGGF
ncbi:MAG TPA: DUF393 domain-containing protein [Rhodobacteraceae bacterium]|nr:DUF393 domain-containing protein [Paracoccaceae bacterium]